MTEYNILLRAKVDKTSDIQGDVNDLAKSVKLSISKVEIDPAALAAIQEQIAKATRNPKDTNAKGMKVGVDFSDASNAMKTLSNDVEKIRGSFSSLGSNVKVTKLFDSDGIRQYGVSVENVANGMKTIDTYGVKIAKNGEQTITSMKGIEKAVTETSKSQVTLSTLTDGYQVKLDRIRTDHKDAYSSQPVKDLDAAAQSLVSSLDGTAEKSKLADNAIGKLGTGISKTEKETGLLNKSTDNFITTTGKAIGKIALWGIATGILYGSLKSLQEGIQYIKDLNKEMTNIGLVTGQTTNQLTGMATEFNSMAKELGATTLDMAKGATEWIDKIVHYKFFELTGKSFRDYSTNLL